MRVQLAAPVAVVASASARTISGTATLYGVAAFASLGAMIFEPGSLRLSDDLRRVKLLVDHDHAQPVGYATDAADDPERLTVSFYVPPGQPGDDALQQAANGLRDGLSVGVWIDDDGYSFDADDTLRVTSGEVREVSLCALPAFNDARVTDVAASAAAWRAAHAAESEGPAMPCATCGQVHAAGVTCAPNVNASTTPPAPAPAPVTAAVQAAPITPPRASANGLSLQAMADRAIGMIQAGQGQLLQAALVDVIPSDDAGEADRPQWAGELWQASRIARPIIDGLGTPRPLTSLKVMGFKRVYTDIVDDYLGDKTAIPSFDYTTLPAEADAKRIAGGNDVDRAFFDLGDGSFMRDWFVAATDDYKLKSEAAVATALLAAATVVAGTTSVIGAINSIASGLKGIGASMDTTVLSPGAWDDLSEITTADAPWWLAGSTLNLRDQDGNVSSVSIEVNPALTGLQVLGYDERAATFYEKNPPVQVRAENVPNGGIDVGVFGYYALIVNDTRAVRKATYVPA